MVRRELAASSASRAAGPLIEGDRRLRQMVAEHEVAQETAMLKLRPIGPHDYSVLEDSQRIGRIRLADERMPPVWLKERHHPWARPGTLRRPKVDFKAAWERLLARTSKDELAAAYKAMNIRNDG